MTDLSKDRPIITISTQAYGLFLGLYPARFQREYGPQMAQVFRDCSLRALRQGGGIGIIELWVLTLLDLARSLLEEHAQKETGMTNSNFTRVSGWALILVAVIYLLFFSLAYFDVANGRPESLNVLYSPSSFALAVDHPGLLVTGVPAGLRPLYNSGYYALIFASPVLLAVGLLGVRSRYGDSVGSFGKQVLLVGLLAGLSVSLIGIVGEAVFSWDPAWFAQFAGPAAMFAGLALFGIPFLSRRLLPRRNALPLLAGLGYPLLVLYVALGLAGDGVSGEGLAVYILIALMAAQCVALFMLGYLLQSEAPQPRPAFA